MTEPGVWYGVGKDIESADPLKIFGVIASKRGTRYAWMVLCTVVLPREGFVQRVRSKETRRGRKDVRNTFVRCALSFEDLLGFTRRFPAAA